MLVDTKQKVANLLENVKTVTPLIHQITNYVTVNDCANVTLAIGASPIMADDSKEVASVTGIADALVINLGTLNERTIEAMVIAGRQANKKQIPVVLDPVGAGVSELRNETIHTILQQINVDVIRGNISELGFIAGIQTAAKGVDAANQDQAMDAEWIAKKVANQYNCTVAITGAIDVITDGQRVVKCQNGTPVLSKVTGTGCMTTALIGSFVGATKDPFLSAIAGICTMGIAGELAYPQYETMGTGSFHVGIIDAISKLDTESMKEKMKLYE